MDIKLTTALLVLNLWGCADIPGSTGPIRFANSDAAPNQDTSSNHITDMMAAADARRAAALDASTADLGQVVDVDMRMMLPSCAASDMDRDGFGTNDSCTRIDCDDTNPSIHPDSFEACNGLDDDCNGLADDELGNRMCGTGQCVVSVPNCVDGQVPVCVAGKPSDEICNGQDDDCDGQEDEDIALATCGVGACERRVQCVQGQVRDCVPGEPIAETCNSLDDDCDGVIDNGFRARIIQSTYSTLDDFHPNCDGSTDRFGTDCNAAMNRFCRAQECGTTGFGPAEHNGDIAHVTCISGAAPHAVEYNTLWQYHEGCVGPGNAMQGVCYAAIHRYCSQTGHVTGFGPAELGANNMQVVCLDDGVQVIQTLYSILSQHHPPCNGRSESYGPNCNAAIKRWCLSEGYASGFGPLEHNGDSVAVACLSR
jgi:hypothetical protein